MADFDFKDFKNGFEGSLFIGLFAGLSWPT